MDGNTPGFPVLYYLHEFVLTHVHWVNDAIQPSHFLLSPSPPALSLSLHQGLFQWVSSSHQVAKVIGASADAVASVLPMNIQGRFTLRLTDLSSLLSKGHSRVLQCYSSNTLIFQYSAFFMVQLSHLYVRTDKKHSFDYMDFVGKWYLPFNMLSRFIITFLPRSKCLLISWLKSPFTVILEPRKIKSVTVSILFFPHLFGMMGCHDLSFWMLSFKPLSHSPVSPSSGGSLGPVCFLPLGWRHLYIWGYWYFS